MSDDTGIFALELFVKSTLILGLAHLVVASFRRLSASERHLILAFAVLSALALPALMQVTPSTEVPFSILGDSDTNRAVATAGNRSPAATNASSDSRLDSGPARSMPAETNRNSLVGEIPGTRLAGMLAAIYLAGALSLLTCFAVRALRLTQCARSLPPPANSETLKLVDAERRALGIRRTVRVLTTSKRQSPWVFGILSPAIVLPAGFDAWTIERRRSAVIHELTHVARLDQLSLWLGQLCCALYWFQPLAWLAAVRMDREAERACDDRVLMSGISEAGYAQQLLDMANKIFNEPAPPKSATAMARTSMVSDRIRSILDSRMRRVTMNRPTITLIVAAGLLTVGPIASLKSQENDSPTSSEDLARVVRSYLDNYQIEQAAGAIASWITSHSSCAYCTDLLYKQWRAGTNDEYSALLAALDDVEQSALDANDGELLVRLASIALGSGNKEALRRGEHYLFEARSIGNVGAESYPIVLNYFVEAGRFEDALALIDRMRQDESFASESRSLDNWARYLSSEIERSSLLLNRIVDSQTEDNARNEYMPVYKVAPVYPVEAEQAGLEGNALVEFTVTPMGRTKDIVVISSTNSIFEQASIDATTNFRYFPRTIDGEAVEVPGVRNRIVFALPVPH
jgi:TonB family protein